MFRIKYSREVILKLLYQFDVLKIKDQDPRTVLAENMAFFKGLNEVETEFILKLMRHVLADQEDIDRQLSGNLIGWKLSRLNVVERTLLRIGLGESSFNPERAIIIDDMVRIAKKYGDTDSYKIINAVLDKTIP